MEDDSESEEEEDDEEEEEEEASPRPRPIAACYLRGPPIGPGAQSKQVWRREAPAVSVFDLLWSLFVQVK